MLLTIGTVLATACILHPEERLRAMVTDRPSLTFAPTSVAAGHLQLETDMLVGAWNGDRGALTVGGSTLRLGLTPETDLQVSFPTLTVARDDLFADGQSTSVSTGGFALRLKWNLVGNDGGGFGLGVLPVLAIDGDNVVSASVIVPVHVALPADFGLGAMVEVDAIKPGAAIDVRGLVTLVASHPVFDDVSGYFEAQADIRTVAAEGDVVRTGLLGSAGLTWSVSDNLQVDSGLRLPLTGVAPTLEVFAGVSLRR
jgi:hypothetical protein